MAYATIAHLLYETAFAARVQQLSTIKSALINSGIVARDPLIDSLVTGAGVAGKVVNLPFFNDLAGDDEEMAENTPLTPAAITGGRDIARIHRRAKAFGEEDLAVAFAGSDPLETIAALYAAYQIRQRQRMLFSSLKGVFAHNVATDSSDLVMDISEDTGDDAFLDKDTLLYAAQLLGDAKGMLTSVAMHSAAAVKATAVGGSSLFRPASETQPLATYNGLAIVEDDSCAFDPATGIADIVLFAKGAVSYAPAMVKTPFEVGRVELAGQTHYILRDGYIQHLRGYAWTPTTDTAATPTHALVQDAASYTRVYEKKQIRACMLRCKVLNP